MKKFGIFLLIIILMAATLYAGDCDDVDCPSGWDVGETGWVLLQLNNPTPPSLPDYCVAKICYCYDLDSLENEGPHFYIKKIIWADSSCYFSNYASIDYDFLKLMIISEFVRIHQNDIPVTYCPDTWSFCELISSFCYADFIHYGYPVSVPCDGDGYCVQNYRYCWNTNVSPPKIEIESYGPQFSYPGTCNLPTLTGPGWQMIHDCITWCGN